MSLFLLIFGFFYYDNCRASVRTLSVTLLQNGANYRKKIVKSERVYRIEYYGSNDYTES